MPWVLALWRGFSCFQNTLCSVATYCQRSHAIPPWRSLCAVVLTIITFGAEHTVLFAQDKELSLIEVQTRALPFLLFSSRGPAVAQDGTVYSTLSADQEVRVLALADGRTRKVRLHGLSQEVTSWQLGP